MPYSEAQRRANLKYERENYERISIMLKKGDRAKVKALAEKSGKSINAWAKELIYAQLAAAEDSEPTAK